MAWWRGITVQTIRTPNKHGLHAQTPCQKPLLTKKYIKGWLKYAKINLHRPVDFWKNVLWSNVTKLDFSGPMGQNNQGSWVEEHHPYCQTWRWTNLVMWVLCCYSLTVWLQVSGLFSEDYNAFQCVQWSLMIIRLSSRTVISSMHPNLPKLVQGSVSGFKSHWKIFGGIWRKQHQNGNQGIWVTCKLLHIKNELRFHQWGVSVANQKYLCILTK